MQCYDITNELSRYVAQASGRPHQPFHAREPVKMMKLAGKAVEATGLQANL